MEKSSREEIITHYFHSGLSYTEIISFLFVYHGIQITLRQLNRILRKLGLFRRKFKASITSVISAIQTELESSSSSFGYRMMHQNLRQKKLVVDRETVRIAMRSLDPEGMKARSRHRLQRRVYNARGPNYVWHIDGYDKIKPYGFAIHGAIDGYSRKILWLKVLAGNNNPKMIGTLYLNYVSQSKITPRLVRSDRGSENVAIAGLQRYFLRSNDFANSSFRFGSSTANQRIESWWSIMRRSRLNWWINFFKDLRDQSHFDASIAYHVDALRFSFMGLLQSELDETRELWNNHRIREVRNSECPAGRPDILYHLPPTPDAKNFGFDVSEHDIELGRSFCQKYSKTGCSEEMLKFGLIVMAENNFEDPSSAVEAKELYLKIISDLRQMIY